MGSGLGLLQELEGETSARLREQAGAIHLVCNEDHQYSPGAFGRRAWEDQANGIVYPSVRDPSGECAAVLRPPVLSATWQGRHLGYEWDGDRIRHVLELRLVE